MKAALNDLNVFPKEAFFIDDSIRNCDGAKKLGMKTFLLSRDVRLYIYNKFTCRNHIVVRNLSSVLRKISK